MPTEEQATQMAEWAREVFRKPWRGDHLVWRGQLYHRGDPLPEELRKALREVVEERMVEWDGTNAIHPPPAMTEDEWQSARYYEGIEDD